MCVGFTRQCILILLGLCCGMAQAAAPLRSPSLTLDPAAQWQLGAPPLQPVLERFFLSRNCKLYLLSWFIYDSKQGKRLSEADVRAQFPQLNHLPVRDCPFAVPPAQLEQALHIKLPSEPGLVLIYMDFNYERDSLEIILTPAQIEMHQQRLDSLSQLKTIPKYFILSPHAGKKSQF